MPEDLQKSAKNFKARSGKHQGILDPINAARQFQLNRYLPSPGLAPFVEHYWIIRWDLRGQPPYVFEVLPYPSVNLAFSADRAWITGVTTGMYEYTAEGAGLIVGTMFKPGGFYAFWPQRIATLTDKTLDATEVFPEAHADFRRALLDLSDDTQMAARLEELLLARHPRADRNLAFINTIVAAVVADRDLRTVEMAARQFHVSERTLQHLFQKYVGVGLKWVIMRYRLIEAAERAARLPKPNWADIAAELGYGDQAHFINDFRNMIGKSPLQYMQSIHS
ncbi:hypothetical protein TFLX_01021 [Thermoflexales bacterium]|nr:hypothetical protein TFLX_01021 [Thermoflexales bacterium]